MDDDWDLHAVVRGCCSASPTAASAAPSAVTTSTPAVPQSYVVSFSSKQSCSLSITDPFQSRNFIGDLDDLYKPFFPKSSSLYSTVCAPVSSSPASFSVAKEHRPKQSKPSICSSTSRSKRRKNQLKKVCQVPAEAIASDIWAWRKYGQKPIKGSPYPRGYYRCSSSKGCLARKQVERNRSDPGIFIVTYTGEHNHSAPTHRNSLAGSTRQKSATSGEASQPSPAKPSCSSPTTSFEGEALAQSANTESREEREIMEDDEEDEEFGEFSDVGLNDDFFAGLEELNPPAAGDFFSDHYPANFGLPTIASSAATAAGGI